MGWLACAMLAGCDDQGGTGGGGHASTSTSASTVTGSTASSSGATTTSSSSSSSATGSSTSTGSGVATAECASASDCSLAGNCCTCAGLANGEVLPACMDTGCALDKCMDAGYMGTLDCVLGRCTAGLDCDSTKVACAAPQPICPPGQANSVKGACWGPCVDASECAFVPDCTNCGPGQACVHYGGGVMKTYCIPVDAECGGVASCACMGKSLCGGVPCGEANGELTCQAP
ncbi:MAG: hypothetical protein U0414_00100 [Polyangiaceae bacterium]